MKITDKQRGKLLVAWGKTVAKLTPLKAEIEASDEMTCADELAELYLAQFLYAARSIITLEYRNNGNMKLDYERLRHLYIDRVVLTDSNGHPLLYFYTDDPLKIEER